MPISLGASSHVPRSSSAQSSRQPGLSTGHMDSGRSAQREVSQTQQQWWHRQRTGHHDASLDLRSVHHTRPLYQTQLPEAPPAHSNGRATQYANQSKLAPNATLYRQQRSIVSDQGFDGRRGHRPSGLRGLPRRESERPSEQSIDPNRLYPQMSPRIDQLSSRSAPEDMEFFSRSISQPTTPSFRAPVDVTQPIPSLGIPRAPTYPPTGRRRINSTTGVEDAAFDDEEEFRLFAEATAGLGPELAYRYHPPNPSLNSLVSRTRSHSTSGYRNEESRSYGSPQEVTPTTRLAMQELAGMPQNSQQERMQSSVSGLDLWLQHSSSSSPLHHLERSDPDYDNDDEELPNYAESQAQAQAQQRAQAASRAQELQRRWQQSGARHGRS